MRKLLSVGWTICLLAVVLVGLIAALYRGEPVFGIAQVYWLGAAFFVFLACAAIMLMRHWRT